MILIPKPWTDWKQSDKTEEVTSITKKEEVELLSQDKNKKLQAELIEYKKQNIIRWKKWGKKPEIKIEDPILGDIIWECDKMEPDRTEVDSNNVFKMTIQTGDILQVNNTQRFTDEDKARELTNLEGKKASERTEIQAKEKIKIGQEYICKFSFKIPKGFPFSANRLVIGQWKQETKAEWASQNPFLAQKLNRKKLQFIINTNWDITGQTWSTIIANIPIKKYVDKRINMEYQFKFSDKDDGYLKIKMKWENDTKYTDIVDYHWKLASDTIGGENKWEDKAYFKFWLYRDNYDYGIKVLEKSNQKELNENLKKDITDREKAKNEKEIKKDFEKNIAAIEKAKEDEKNGHPMTIYFKGYSVESTEKSG